ncbi:hypothetical protein [Xanthobacter versatilis]|uniref:hypothetical protein n=1 Tax=Xanthobacter autotrophicus (strain ATCC BAA-1158 / Py2) TaxID=78245 RepID=UPI0037293855
MHPKHARDFLGVDALDDKAEIEAAYRRAVARLAGEGEGSERAHRARDVLLMALRDAPREPEVKVETIEPAETAQTIPGEFHRGLTILAAVVAMLCPLAVSFDAISAVSVGLGTPIGMPSFSLMTGLLALALAYIVQRHDRRRHEGLGRSLLPFILYLQALLLGVLLLADDSFVAGVLLGSLVLGIVAIGCSVTDFATRGRAEAAARSAKTARTPALQTP